MKKSQNPDCLNMAKVAKSFSALLALALARENINISRVTMKEYARLRTEEHNLHCSMLVLKRTKKCSWTDFEARFLDRAARAFASKLLRSTRRQPIVVYTDPWKDVVNRAVCPMAAHRHPLSVLAALAYDVERDQTTIRLSFRCKPASTRKGAKPQ